MDSIDVEFILVLCNLSVDGKQYLNALLGCMCGDFKCGIGSRNVGVWAGNPAALLGVWEFWNVEGAEHGDRKLRKLI